MPLKQGPHNRGDLIKPNDISNHEETNHEEPDGGLWFLVEHIALQKQI